MDQERAIGRNGFNNARDVRRCDGAVERPYSPARCEVDRLVEFDCNSRVANRTDIYGRGCGHGNNTIDAQVLYGELMNHHTGQLSGNRAQMATRPRRSIAAVLGFAASWFA